MAASGHLHTVSENHSLREAVIFFILTSRIQNVESYRMLIKEGGSLYGQFHQFDKIKFVSSSVEQNRSDNSTEVTQSVERGFKMISFKDGKTKDMLQVLTEKNISTLSYNSLDYSNWESFLDKGLKACGAIGDKDGAIEVQAIGIMFIDEFFFDPIPSYDPKELFNEDSLNIPKSVFGADSATMSLNTHHKGSSGNERDHIENLSIKVFDRENTKRVMINGNVIIQVHNKPLREYLNADSKETRNILDFGHSQNKSMLRDILSMNAKQLIGL